MASKICNLAEFYKKLADFLRSNGQARLADAVQKVHEFLSKIGNCDAAPPAIKEKVKAMAPRANEPVAPSDIAAALKLASDIAEATQ